MQKVTLSSTTAIIDRLIAASNSSNASEMSKKIGFSSGAVSQWKKRDSVPEGSIARCAAKTGASLNWLKTGEGEMFSGQSVAGQASHEGDSGAISNLQLMQNLIQWVEEGCQEHGVKIKPAAKAKLLIKLYKIFSKENPEVQRDEVVRHLRLVA